MAVQLARRRFTVEEYERMAEAGILGEDDRVELIDGEIVQMTPIGSAHAGRINRLNQFLGRQLGDTAIVSVQNPIRLAERSEPQPDIAVLRPRADYYAEGHPTAADVLLVIELADTSLAYDRDVKVPLYTRAGIPEAWLFDVLGESITRHADPVDGAYRLVEPARRGQRLASTILPALVLEVDAVMGRRSP